jgi:hypothetical protein
MRLPDRPADFVANADESSAQAWCDSQPVATEQDVGHKDVRADEHTTAANLCMRLWNLSIMAESAN